MRVALVDVVDMGVMLMPVAFVGVVCMAGFVAVMLVVVALVDVVDMCVVFVRVAFVDVVLCRYHDAPFISSLRPAYAPERSRDQRYKLQ